MFRKIKVLHLGSPSGLYGAERWILSLIKYLDPNRIESSIGVINDGDYVEIPLCAEAERLNIPTCIVKARGRFNLYAVTKLREYIKTNDIDIVHTHFYKTDLIGFLAAIGTRCKVISTPHGWASKPSLRLGAYQRISRLVFPFLDAVVPLSEGILSPLQRIPLMKLKLHLIKNGVDIGEVEDQVKIADEMLALRNDGNFILGYIGRLTSGKGLDVLLHTIACNSEPHWHVALIGEGEQASELSSMAEELGIADRIHFYGFRPDRLAFLKGFDVFVLPSRSEGIPRCLMESMAAEVPIIATDIPGCRNLIDGERTGLLFPVDDVQALGDCIKKMSRTENLRNAFKKNAKTFLKEHYSASRMAREYEELYGNVITAKAL